MVTKHFMQGLVKQVCRRMIAHDVVTADQVHFSGGLVANFRLTRDDLPNVRNDSSRRATNRSYFDLPIFAADVAFIIHLTTRLNVETSLGQDDFHLIIERGG